MEFRDLQYNHLSIPSWVISADACWCLLGGNASGKSQLASLLRGQAHPEAGEILDLPHADSVLCVSFESQQERYEEELRNDDTDFLDRLDTGTTGLELLMEAGDEAGARAYAEKFELGELLDRGIRLFSSGELRKILLLKEVLKRPALLILDEPYEGLDVDSRAALDVFCRQLVEEGMTRGQSVLLLVNRLDDVADWCTHLALLQKGCLLTAGERTTVLKQPEVAHLLKFDTEMVPELPSPPASASGLTSLGSGPLVEMKDLSVHYGEITQFEGFDWTLHPGQHSLITGPNGAGKSTLLQLIIGEHPQCYTNDLKVFGYQRGSGESIWEIKQHIGLVSASLHRDYRAPGNLLSVVVSGLFDSIGLYQKPQRHELALAMQWLDLIGLGGDKAKELFQKQSYGQQRLVLIARGLIKQPPLLILDEPTQGLDDINRYLVLAFIEKLAVLERTTMLFVSHRQDEHLELFEHRVHFEASDRTGVRYEAKVLAGR